MICYSPRDVKIHVFLTTSPLSSLESPHPHWIPNPAHIALTSPKDPEFPWRLRSSQEDLFLHCKPLALSVCNIQILPSSVPHFPSINGMPCKNFSLDCQIREAPVVTPFYR